MSPTTVRSAMPASWLGGRFEASNRTLALAAGDLVAIALFVAVGEVRHAGSLSSGLATLTQFGVGWVVASLWVGAYAVGVRSTPWRAVRLGATAWILAALVGLVVRLLTTPETAIPVTFILTSIGFGALFVGGWRFVATRWLLAG